MFRLLHASSTSTDSMSETPTYFGPPESPLFGVVSLPTDRLVRGGVVICPSLGKESMDSVRLYRTLARELSGRGFVVLWFDYLGLGDSSLAQDRDAAVHDWKASVGHAVGYLTQIGAQSVTAIGVRAGCLILDAYMGESAGIDRIVYLDPSATGRRYLREHNALFRLAIGDDAGRPGESTIIGQRLTERAAREFSGLRIGTNPVADHGLHGVLLVRRNEVTDGRVTELEAAEGVDSVITGGLAECAQPRDIPLPIPVAAVEAIVGWIDRANASATHPVQPVYSSSAIMRSRDETDAVRETIEHIGPKGLFAIRTEPVAESARNGSAVVFFITSNDYHVGPNRTWVELARRIGPDGTTSIRWDPAGRGMSGAVTGESWQRTYSSAQIDDAVAVATSAGSEPSRLQLVGICSGAWYAAQTARELHAGSAVLINLTAWNWRTAHNWMFEWKVRRRAFRAGVESQGGAPVAEASRVPFRQQVKTLVYRLRALQHEHAPRALLGALNWMSILSLPDAVLTPLARSGTRTTVIMAPGDAEQFTLRNGAATIDRLRHTAFPPVLISPGSGDHPAHHVAILDAIEEAVAPAVRTEESLENQPVQRAR